MSRLCKCGDLESIHFHGTGVCISCKCQGFDPVTAREDQPRKLPIDRPCSACSAGDYEMEYHDHRPPFSKREDQPRTAQLKCWHCNELLGSMPYGVGPNGAIHWACYDKLWPNRIPLVPEAQGEPAHDSSTCKDQHCSLCPDRYKVLLQLVYTLLRTDGNSQLYDARTYYETRKKLERLVEDELHV